MACELTRSYKITFSVDDSSFHLEKKKTNPTTNKPKPWIAIKTCTMLQEKNQMVQACWIKLLRNVKQKRILNDFLNPCFDNLRGQSDLNSPKQRVVPGFIGMYSGKFR